jgi:hypothetical protein
VGISARTSISVYRQYLDAAQSNRLIPKILRVDLGTETSQMGDAHLLLRRCRSPPIQLSECFYQGRSTANQRIESWWGQLATSSLFLYYEFFHILQKEGVFTQDYIPEQVRGLRKAFARPLHDYHADSLTDLSSRYLHADSSYPNLLIYPHMEYSPNSPPAQSTERNTRETYDELS